MKRSSTLFLKTVLILLALGVLVICVFALPAIIGTVSWGGYDPILLGMYVPAIPFFMALYQAWNLLTYIDQGKPFSTLSITALRNIKYCGLAISLLYAIGMPYIFHVANKDDAPGVVLIGLIIVGASLVIAVFAGVLQKLIENGMEIKTENDLTV